MILMSTCLMENNIFQPFDSSEIVVDFNMKKTPCLQLLRLRNVLYSVDDAPCPVEVVPYIAMAALNTEMGVEILIMMGPGASVHMVSVCPIEPGENSQSDISNSLESNVQGYPHLGIKIASHSLNIQGGVSS